MSRIRTFYIDHDRAVGFYQKPGLQVVSDEFWEEGVLHVKMEMDICVRSLP